MPSRISSARLTSSRPRFSSAESDSPSRHSITRKGTPGSSGMPFHTDTSKMRTMFSWSSRATARASASASASKPGRGSRNLSATSRRSVSSRARNTWPIPPPPIHSRTSYRRPSGPPSTSPGSGSTGNGSDCPSSRRKESSKSEAPDEASSPLMGSAPCSPSCVASLLIPCSGGATAAFSWQGSSEC